MSRFEATAKGPGLTSINSSHLQPVIDACLDFGEKTWVVRELGGDELLLIPATKFRQHDLFRDQQSDTKW